MRSLELPQLPSLKSVLQAQLDVAQSSIDRLMHLRESVDSSRTCAERSRAAETFAYEERRVSSTVEDLRTIRDISTKLFDDLGEGVSKEFGAGLMSFMPQIMSEFKLAA
jgi:hypothetical protein